MNTDLKPRRCPVCRIRVAMTPDHLTSFLHTHGQEMRLLLKNPETTLAGIARRFSVSRQLVHQTLRRLEIPTTSHLDRRTYRAREEMRKIPSFQFLFALIQFGIALEPVLIHRTGKTYTASRRLVMINGKRCLIRRASISPAIGKRWGAGYVCLPPVNLDSPLHRGLKFVIYRLPARFQVEGVLVVPAGKLKASNVIVKLDGYKDGYPRGKQTEWRGYLNNWSSLLQRGSAPLGTPHSTGEKERKHAA